MDNKATIITEASECVIKQFMDCAFKGKYKVLLIDGEATEDELKHAFELIYAQHVDISGLYQTREFEMSAYINSLDTRVATIERFIELQLKFVHEFGLPFIPGFQLVKKYGHNLYWNPAFPDAEGFKNKLDQIKSRENKYRSILTTKVNELIEFRKKQVNKEFNLLESRKGYITTINRLQQAKFVIDKSATTVEDLALMIKDYKDQIETEKMEAKVKKH